MLNKRNINSVCLSRKDLLSDKVSTEGPPRPSSLTRARTHTHSPPTPSAQLIPAPPRSSSRAHALRHTQTIQILSQ